MSIQHSIVIDLKVKIHFHCKTIYLHSAAMRKAEKTFELRVLLTRVRAKKNDFRSKERLKVTD